MLSVRGLHKVYDGHGRRVEAVGDLTFSVEAGRFVCIVGPSGCGKTTLLRCIAGLLPPTAGTVTVSGKPVAGPPDGLAVVFQEYGRSLFPWLRVADNVDLPLRAAGLPRARRLDLVDERDQLGTRGDPRFAELRGHVYAQIQKAKQESA